jgi:UDP-N-acetylglucosamine--N-acetylmuramyl-(pentapeptide) pyrophosphoryl-undecaprenol N-acetylglucosamine transferase
MRVLFAGGGTGGHLYPALAVAEALGELDSGGAIAFIGTPHRLEARLVPALGLPFTAVDVMGFPRRPGAGWIHFLAKLVKATLQSHAHLREWRADLVVGTGGYICAPAVLAARFAGIPVVLLEQNVFPGLANRSLATLARTVYTSFDLTQQALPAGKAICHGNPIRTGWQTLDRSTARQKLGWAEDKNWLVIVGGSLGARVLNQQVEALMDRLMPLESWHVLHLTGERDHAEVVARTARWCDSGRYTPVAYHEDLPTMLMASDLVVSRAGATTVAELTAIGRPAILVPFEHGGKDQPANARALERSGAALVVREAHIEDLAAVVAELAADEIARTRMGQASLALGRPEAARDVALDILARGRDPRRSQRIDPGVS